MSIPAPDPYATAGWTIQHRHRTSAEPPHLEADTSRENREAAAGSEHGPETAEFPGEKKPRLRKRP